MKPPRVVHVSAIGATSFHLLLPQARAARAAGYEVAFAHSPDPEYTPRLQAEGFPVFEVPIPRKIDLAQDRAACLGLVEALRDWQPDIVHTHTSKGGAVGRVAGRLLKARVVHTIHGFPFIEGQPPARYWTYLSMEWTLARTLTDLLLSQSQEDVAVAQRYGIRARLGYPRWIGNGVDVTRFDPDRVRRVAGLRAAYGLGPREALVLTIARITPEKGLAEALEALTINQELPWHWFLVGYTDDAEFEAQFRSRIAELGLEERIHLLGTRHDITEILAEADWFYLPSHREGVPRSMIEAHAMGVPVITTDVRGCREVARHRETGFVVPLGDIPALAGAVATALTLEPVHYQAMRVQARERALAEFDERAVVARILDAYGALLDLPGGREEAAG